MGSDGATPQQGPAFDELRDMIVEGALVPGLLYDVEELAAKLHQPAAAVEEAAFRLLHEGLLAGRPDGTFEVAPLSLRQGADLIDCFELLMPPVYRVMARTATPEDLEEMGRALDDADAAVAAGDAVRLVRSWLAFHLVACRRMGNSEYLRIARSLWARAERYMLLAAPPTHDRDVQTRVLRRVLRGLERRDVNEVVTALLQNYERLRTLVSPPSA